MKPLTEAEYGTRNVIARISGDEAGKSALEQLGFHSGDEIIVVADRNGDLIVSIEGISVALSKDLAQRVMI